MQADRYLTTQPTRCALRRAMSDSEWIGSRFVMRTLMVLDNWRHVHSGAVLTGAPFMHTTY